jgi:hypothetical protein
LGPCPREINNSNKRRGKKRKVILSHKKKEEKRRRNLNKRNRSGFQVIKQLLTEVNREAIKRGFKKLKSKAILQKS